MRHDPEFHLHLARRQQRRRGAPKSLLGLAICAAAALGWSLAPEAPPPAATSDIERTLAGPPSATERVPARRFGFCHQGGGRDCVVDGDTFRLDGERIRIADIDTPETHPPRCAEEARLGEAATRRLRALLSGGALTLEMADRDTDRYGRKLRIVRANGRSVGDALVSEGLARRWEGRRRPWCEG